MESLDSEKRVSSYLESIAKDVNQGSFSKAALTNLIDAIQSNTSESAFLTEATRTLVQVSAIQGQDRVMLCRHLLGPIMGLMQKHPQHFDLQLNCCWVLVNLAIETANRRPIVESALDELLAVAANSRSIAYVQVVSKLAVGEKEEEAYESMAASYFPQSSRQDLSLQTSLPRSRRGCAPSPERRRPRPQSRTLAAARRHSPWPAAGVTRRGPSHSPQPAVTH